MMTTARGGITAAGRRRGSLRRPALFLAVALTAVLVLASMPTSSLGQRTFETKVDPPLRFPTSVAFDAQGRVWISDFGQGNNPPGTQGIYLYDAYPSHTLLAGPNTRAAWAEPRPALDVNKATGELFVADSNSRDIAIFDENGKYLRSWTAINKVAFGGKIHVAIDNSSMPSRGRVYLALTEPENSVDVFDDRERPVDFPASAGYIDGNSLTGTPSGPFGSAHFVEVDNSNGDIYVTDTTNKVVDRFAWTGEFQGSISVPKAQPSDCCNIGFGGVGVDPTNGHILVTEGPSNGSEGGITEFDRWGNLLGRITNDGSFGYYPEGEPAVDAAGHLYVPAGNFDVDIFSAAPPLASVSYEPVTAETTSSGVVHAEIDPSGGGSVTDCVVEYGTSPSYGLEEDCSPDPAAAPPGSNFSTPTEVSATLTGLTPDTTTYHYRVVATNQNGAGYGSDQTYTTHKVVGLRTDEASGVSERAATLNASLIGDGTTADYYFEWGRTSAYGNTTAGEPAGSPTGPGRTELSAGVTLEPITTYHFRVAASSSGNTSYGEDRVFTTPPGIPSIQAQRVTEVHSDRAVLHGDLNPNGAPSSYRFEYVDDPHFQESGFTEAVEAPLSEIDVGMSRQFQPVSISVDGLTPGTLYHYRLVGTNAVGEGVPNVDKTFKTYPFGFEDKCPNAHVRQQTSSALLLDCRAYELASAANAGGYDVESNMSEGQDPFAQYPYSRASSTVLYGTHNGGIPGTGRPTNRGVDPYVARRGASGWATEYVGIPANNPFATAPFGSELQDADAALGTFSFGGADICDPCFEDGKAGEPVHLPDGRLVQGMAGSMDPGPGAEPDGFVAKHLSADGSHFVFGSSDQFEPDGNSNGDVSIYLRDLEAETTSVVSKTPLGATMTGPGIAELDVSADGSRVVLGRLVSTDSEGNRHWHLYMAFEGADTSVDLMPAATGGALYDGMTADGRIVYLSSRDALAADDTDTSADVYRVDVQGGAAALTRVSTGDGGAGNTDGCDPSANVPHPRWNSVGTEANCDALAIGGGGGVASGDGRIFFLSPEALDTSDPANQPVVNAPNLYVAPVGAPPQFIRTLESSSNAPLPDITHPHLRSFGAFINPLGVAIDPVDGSMYVMDVGFAFEVGSGYIYKYDSEGHAVLSFGQNGKLTVPGAYGAFSMPGGIAVDSDPSSPNYRSLFVPDFVGAAVKAYDPSGNLQFSIEVGGPSAPAIDPSNGNIYVSQYFEGRVSAFSPTGASLGGFNVIPNPTGVAVHDGRVYVVNGGGLFATQGKAAIFTTAGAPLGELDAGPARGIAADPVDGHVIVDKISYGMEYDATGAPVGPVGAGIVDNSSGVALDAGRVLLSSRGTSNAASFGPLLVPSNPATDNPVVVHSLSPSSTRFPGDFQVTPSGQHAVFGSTLPLTGYDNGGHGEVFRYQATTDSVDCASCNPTGEQATGEAALPEKGLGVTDDGRVFYNSTEGLVDRDLNEAKDAYEWKPDQGIELISTGAAPLGASLLGVSADGTDAFFFTRETLAAEDANGSRVKLYDARSDGGFPYVPPPVPCKASDECHGPGSPAPAAPVIGSVTGTPIGNTKSNEKCNPRKKKKKKCGTHRKHRKHKKSRRGGRR